MGALRRSYRIALLALLLAAGLTIAIAAFPLLGAAARERIVAGWSRALMRVCGITVREVVAPDAAPLAQFRGAMLLANHVSWLDVFAIDSVAPASFVAKAEVARWPLVGTLVSRVGTVYIDRGRRHAVHDVNLRLERRLREGARVAVFPEGTTCDGSRLLPFYGNLAQAALAAGAPVVPVALRYVDRDGRSNPAPLYVGETTFVESLWRIAGDRGSVCELHVLPAIATADGVTRQQIARSARDAISRRLGLAPEDTAPASPPDPTA
ncbi:MAG TPA: lysophospholipid acyltransferase family protein [Burkholderiaceae bacterium]|nr:lysophospholipid acyltransferase family protein [Burkholderiaceae bacterium]